MKYNFRVPDTRDFKKLLNGLHFCRMTFCRFSIDKSVLTTLQQLEINTEEGVTIHLPYFNMFLIFQFWKFSSRFLFRFVYSEWIGIELRLCIDDEGLRTELGSWKKTRREKFFLMDKFFVVNNGLIFDISKVQTLQKVCNVDKLFITFFSNKDMLVPHQYLSGTG